MWKRCAYSKRVKAKEVLMKILVVEDNSRISALLVRGLTEEGYVVDACSDGEVALYRAAVNSYDLIVLDVSLPSRDGISVCQEIRRQGITSSILMLTARDTLQDKISGLDAGADDYITKPFEYEELLARLRALLRRGTGSTVLVFADLTLDPAKHCVERAGRLIELSAREYRLLEYFMRHPNEILSRTRIAEYVWAGEAGLDSNVVDVYISYLRAKIDKPFKHSLIQTIRNMGYTLRISENL
jgi:DNA-binding response OmpR family regulator